MRQGWECLKCPMLENASRKTAKMRRGPCSGERDGVWACGGVGV